MLPNGTTADLDGTLIIRDQGGRVDDATRRGGAASTHAPTRHHRHGVTRFETQLAHDVVARQDGSIWFTDPSYTDACRASGPEAHVVADRVMPQSGVAFDVRLMLSLPGACSTCIVAGGRACGRPELPTHHTRVRGSTSRQARAAMHARPAADAKRSDSASE